MNIMFGAMLGGWEIVLILAVVLILFGAKKIPELAKGLGSGIKEFKKATREVTEEINIVQRYTASGSHAAIHHRTGSSRADGFAVCHHPQSLT